MEQITNDDFDVFLIQIKKNLYKGQTKDRQSGTSAFAKVNLGLGFEFLLPAGFDKADDQTAAGIFWSEKRPPNIFINEQKDAGFTLQILEEPETEPLNHNRENIKLILEKIDRRVVFYDQGEEKGILWFDYKGFAGNEVTYNLIFLFQVGEEKVLGSFFCPFEAYDRWRPVVFEMLSTVRKEEADEGI